MRVSATRSAECAQKQEASSIDRSKGKCARPSIRVFTVFVYLACLHGRLSACLRASNVACVPKSVYLAHCVSPVVFSSASTGPFFVEQSSCRGTRREPVRARLKSGERKRRARFGGLRSGYPRNSAVPPKLPTKKNLLKRMFHLVGKRETRVLRRSMLSATIFRAGGKKVC